MANPTSLQLSATELRTLTKWADPVIIEFLSLQGAVQEITQNINIVINNVDSAMTTSAQNFALIGALRNAQAAMQEQLSMLDAIPSKLANLRRDLERVINATSEQDSALGSLVTKVASNKRDQQRLIDNLVQQIMVLNGQNAQLSAKVIQQSDMILALSEQVSVPDFSLLGRLTREVDARQDLEQLVMVGG